MGVNKKGIIIASKYKKNVYFSAQTKIPHT